MDEAEKLNHRRLWRNHLDELIRERENKSAEYREATRIARCADVDELADAREEEAITMQRY